MCTDSGFPPCSAMTEQHRSVLSGQPLLELGRGRCPPSTRTDRHPQQPAVSAREHLLGAERGHQVTEAQPKPLLSPWDPFHGKTGTAPGAFSSLSLPVQALSWGQALQRGGKPNPAWVTPADMAHAEPRALSSKESHLFSESLLQTKGINGGC